MTYRNAVIESFTHKKIEILNENQTLTMNKKYIEVPKIIINDTCDDDGDIPRNRFTEDEMDITRHVSTSDNRANDDDIVIANNDTSIETVTDQTQTRDTAREGSSSLMPVPEERHVVSEVVPEASQKVPGEKRRGSLVAHLLRFVGVDRRGSLSPDREDSLDLHQKEFLDTHTKDHLNMLRVQDNLDLIRKGSDESSRKDSLDLIIEANRKDSEDANLNGNDNFGGRIKDRLKLNRKPSADVDQVIVDANSKLKNPGRRKMSIFGNVLRRVSIHRRESMPAHRRSVFFFRGHQSSDDSDSDDDGNGNLEKGENGRNCVSRANKAEEKQLNKQILIDGLFTILSGLYGVLLVVMGAVIPLTETFVEPDSDYVFEGFYMYLYIVSIAFLIYVYVYLLRRNRLKTEFLTRTLSRSRSWTKAWAKAWAKGEATNDSKTNRRKRHISMDTNHHTGSFYLRLGAVGFGIGSMIHSGLLFGQYFQVYDGPAYCTDLIQAFKPFLHLMFTFIQLYLIFMNSKLRIHRYRTLARFGLMHMCATNICVWFRSIVVETLHVIHQHQGHHSDHVIHELGGIPVLGNGHGDNYTIGSDEEHHGRRLHAILTKSGTGINNNKTCHWSDMMGEAVESAGPYLYPCTIEYSLMCAGILYVMWTNVGEKPSKIRPDEDEDDEEDMRSQRMSVDCAGSSRGLFLGILVTVGVIISIIAFYVLINQRNQPLQMSAVILTHLSETIIYLVTTVALCLAVFRMKDLHFHAERKSDLEDTLILISYTGLLGFATFSLTAAFMRPDDVRSWLTMLSSLVMVIQATLQTIFILAGDRLSAASSSQERKKPGREFVTFLLLSNFAMWALNTFETQTPEHNPIQVEVYGPEAWAIFTHVSVPLGIYFRFHSTVCLSNIWKNAWKVRKHM